MHRLHELRAVVCCRICSPGKAQGWGWLPGNGLVIGNLGVGWCGGSGRHGVEQAILVRPILNQNYCSCSAVAPAKVTDHRDASYLLCQAQTPTIHQETCQWSATKNLFSNMRAALKPHRQGLLPMMNAWPRKGARQGQLPSNGPAMGNLWVV